MPHTPHIVVLALLTGMLSAPAAVSSEGAPTVSPPAGPAQTIVVTGQNDVGVDRPAIQVAIDAAGPGDTVELVGTFQLDGQRVFISTSRLTIRGRALDNDGDGEVNEDWFDGFDNDGDGAVDEDPWDTVLRGLVDPTGFPLGDEPTSYFNRALSIDGVNGTLRDVEIRDLRFTQLNRTIGISPGFASTSNLCDDTVLTGGTGENIVVRGNRFDGVIRGPQIFGDTRKFSFEDNVINFSFGTGILLVGDSFGCFPSPDAEFLVGFPIGPVSDGRLSGHRIEAFFVSGMFIVRTERVRVTDNALLNSSKFGFGEGFGFGIELSLSRDNSAYGNSVTGARVGMTGLRLSSNSRISNNRLQRNVLGVAIDFGATGYSVVNNEFVDSGFIDVFLGESTFGNKVVATDFATDVIDRGTDNRLVGTLAMIHNAGLPDDVRAKLEAKRLELEGLVP